PGATAGGTARSTRCAASPWRCRPGRSPPSWGRPARASPRSCAAPPVSTAPPPGGVFLGDTEISRLREHKLTLLRRERIGFVFQSFNLVPSLTAKDNILLPFRLAGKRPDRDWMRDVVHRTGLTERLGHRPAELSGGQQQRVAVARALVTRPEVVFADEPTGALDLSSGQDVLRLLRDVVDGTGQTLIMVTHDPGAAAYADRVLFLADGTLVDAMENPTPQRVADRMARMGA
ncbi:LOW QUALITY PROTEIN: putative ABC transporter, ATP-binding protein, partial [Streptomyces himastatinicus ATCC 53653]